MPFFLLLIICAVGSGAAPSFKILLAATTIDTRHHERAPLHVGLTEGTPALYLVHFASDARLSRRAFEEDLNITLGDYVPHDAFVMAATPDVARVASTHRLVDWVGSYLPAYKLCRSLMQVDSKDSFTTLVVHTATSSVDERESRAVIATVLSAAQLADRGAAESTNALKKGLVHITVSSSMVRTVARVIADIPLVLWIETHTVPSLVEDAATVREEVPIEDAKEPTLVVATACREYAILDGTAPNEQTIGGQSGVLTVPAGWAIAPNDADTRAELLSFTWGTSCLVLADGSAVHADLRACGTRQLVRVGESYGVSSTTQRILIFRAVAACASRNMLANPSFSTLADGSDTRYLAASWRGIPSKVPDGPHDKGYVVFDDLQQGRCIKMLNDGSWQQGARQVILSDAIAGVTSLYLEVTTRAEDVVATAPSSQFSLSLDVQTVDGDYIWDTTLDLVPTDDWSVQSTVVTFSRPVTNVFANLIFRHESGTVFFDDVVIQPASGGTLVDKSSFAAPTPVLIVEHLCRSFALLDGADPHDSVVGGQTSPLTLPEGWALAPDDARTRAALTHHPWASNCIVLAGGEALVPATTDTCMPAALMSAEGAYSVASHLTGARILIYRPVEGCYTQRLNLLANGHFTADVSSWSEIDSGAIHDPRGFIEMSSSSGQRLGLRQFVTAVPANTRKMLVSARVAVQDVLGSPDMGLSLYADVRHSNGTHTWGRHLPLPTGTVAWHTVSTVFEYSQDVSWVAFYTLCRNKTGTVRLDDVNLISLEHDAVATSISTPSSSHSPLSSPSSYSSLAFGGSHIVTAAGNVLHVQALGEFNMFSSSSVAVQGRVVRARLGSALTAVAVLSGAHTIIFTAGNGRVSVSVNGNAVYVLVGPVPVSPSVTLVLGELSVILVSPALVLEIIPGRESLSMSVRSHERGTGLMATGGGPEDDVIHPADSLFKDELDDVYNDDILYNMQEIASDEEIAAANAACEDFRTDDCLFSSCATDVLSSGDVLSVRTYHRIQAWFATRTQRSVQRSIEDEGGEAEGDEKISLLWKSIPRLENAFYVLAGLCALNMCTACAAAVVYVFLRRRSAVVIEACIAESGVDNACAVSS